jgi:hypothetical protein
MKIATEWHGFMPYQIWSGVIRDLNRAALDIRNLTSCGIFSLHHAMVFLGQGHNFQLLRSRHPELINLLRYGMESDELVRLAKSHDLRPSPFESSTIAPIRKAVDRSLAAGHPVIIGSEPQIHWVCLGGRTEDGGYVWADSAHDPAVGGNWSWEEIEEWMTYDEEEEYYPDLEFPFEIITIAPGKNMPASRSMVPWCGSLWPLLAGDTDYAGDWSNLLADMLDVFWDAEYAPKALPVGGFLDEHLDGIIDAAAFQTGISQADLLSVAHGYRDAADFHSLVVPQGQEATAIAGFTLKLVAKAR